MILDKKALEYMIEPIVNECLIKHKGGENYFNELDSMIKNNEVLMVVFLIYAVQDSGINTVVLSGEIGNKYLELYKENKIPDYINLLVVNGGLRKNGEIYDYTCYYHPYNLNKDFIFIDDSYYSGITAKKVKQFIEEQHGNVYKNYVFYDGSKEKYDDVVSLYRYYD